MNQIYNQYGYPMELTECPSCHSKNVSVSGGWEDGNVKTESIDCPDCGYSCKYVIV